MKMHFHNTFVYFFLVSNFSLADDNKKITVEDIENIFFKFYDT